MRQPPWEEEAVLLLRTVSAPARNGQGRLHALLGGRVAHKISIIHNVCPENVCNLRCNCYIYVCELMLLA